MGGGAAPNADTKTVVVLGAAYGGARAAQILAAGIPKGWRIILIDRNTHANHVYVMPRYAVLPGHEYKAFIPYTRVFLLGDSDQPHVSLHAHVTSLRPNHITLSKAFPEYGIPTETIPFDYAIYALGSQLPSPLNLWGSSPDDRGAILKPGDPELNNVAYNGLKDEGIEWLKRKQKLIENSQTVLVVGGGALGIQFATDIKAVHPTKKVTLLHSRLRLLPRFGEEMHTEILKSLESAEIEVILGERLDLDSIEDGQVKINAAKQKVVRTIRGREIAADLLLLCTGQSPNTGLLKAMDPATINPENSLAHVLRTMQLGVLHYPLNDTSKAGVEIALNNLSLVDKEVSEVNPADGPAHLEETPYSNIFVIGDAADAFGAIAAGHNAFYQGEVAARNIIRLIKRQEMQAESNDAVKAEENITEEALELYTPGAPAIKVSLGLTKAVYQIGPTIGVTNEGKEDLQAAAIWAYFGFKIEKDEDMLP